MKFAFILPNLAGGGAEKAVLKLGTALVARGGEVHVVLLESLLEHATPANVPLHTLTASRLSKGYLGKRLAARRLRDLLQRLQQDRPFDLIVSTVPFADEVTTLSRMPHHWCRISNTLSAEVERLRSTHPRKAKRRLARYCRLYGARPLIAVSDGVATDLRTRLRLQHARIERIYNPFDFDEIRAGAAAHAPLPGKPYVIHVGRFAAQKRHDVLLDAWSRLAVPHQLVLLTAPSERLTQMIESRGLAARVTVAGFQANPYPWIKGAKLLVLASDFEGLPNVVIEALVLGTPVVSTDCPSGPREILGAAWRDWLVPVGDPAALARTIERSLAESPGVAAVDLAPYAAATVALSYERIAQEERAR
jgi:glycosyltransferase involved in cell wall biosynthesis